MVGRIARVRRYSGPVFLWDITLGIEGFQLDTRARVDGFIGRRFLHFSAAFFNFLGRLILEAYNNLLISTALILSGYKYKKRSVNVFC